MARFTSPDGTGAPGPVGPTGPAGEDGVGVPAGGNAGDILAKIDGTDFNTEWIQNYTSTVKHIVKNVSGSTLAVGTPVYTKVVNNSSDNIPVDIASNATEARSSKTIGLVAESILNNGFGFVITEGLLAGIDTSAASTGDPVWLGVNGALIFGLTNKPIAPAHLVYLGSVTRGQNVNGEIFVKVQNGYELNELHDVDLDYSTPPADNDVLAYDASSGMWKNQTAAQAGLVTSGAFNYAQTIGTKISNVGTIGATIISASITTNGYPVHVIVTGDAENIQAGAWATIQLYRGSTAIGNMIQVEANGASENIPYALQIIDTPPAGSHTYSMKTQNIAGGSFNFGEQNGPVMCLLELGK